MRIRVRGLGKLPNPCEPGVMLRMLLGTEAGGHSPLARLVAVMLLIGMFALSAPVLIPMVRWIFGLL
jgi:hypothetical protein